MPARLWLPARSRSIRCLRLLLVRRPRSRAQEVPGVAPLSLGQLLDPSITTASRILERATEAPATVYVITAGDIRARGYSTLADVLKDLPGMETVEQYYSEQGTLVPVRGVVGNNKIVLLINGMRVNPPGGEELMIRSDVSVRFAEQIEIIYGPGSTLYGQDAISAVINIKTRRPGDATVEVLGGYGLNDTQGGVRLLRPHLLQAVGAAALGDRLRGRPGLRPDQLPQGLTRSGGRSTTATWRPIGRAGPPARGDIGLNVFVRLESQAHLAAGLVPGERAQQLGGQRRGRPRRRCCSSCPRRAGATARWWSRGSTRCSFSDSGHPALDPDLQPLRGGPRVPLRVPRRHGRAVPGRLQIRHRHQRDARGEARRRAQRRDPPDGRGGGHQLRHHPQGHRARAGPTRDGDIVTQAGSLTYYTEANNPASRVDIHRTVNLHYQQYGAYAEGAHHFNDNLRVIAGVRVDVNTRFDDIPVSPRAALIVQALGGRLTLKYIFSMAYVAPAPYFSYNVFDNGAQISTGNPEPQAGAGPLQRGQRQPGRTEYLLLSASAYYNEQSDLLITAQSEAPETVVDPAGVRRTRTGPARAGWPSR